MCDNGVSSYKARKWYHKGFIIWITIISKVLRVRSIFKGNIISQPIIHNMGRVFFLIQLIDKNLSVVNALFKEPKSIPFWHTFFITLNSSIAITPLSPSQYLFPTFQIREWQIYVWNFTSLRNSMYKRWAVIKNGFVYHSYTTAKWRFPFPLCIHRPSQPCKLSNFMSSTFWVHISFICPFFYYKPAIEVSVWFQVTPWGPHTLLLQFSKAGHHQTSSANWQQAMRRNGLPRPQKAIFWDC